jgi:hypothetical protein
MKKILIILTSLVACVLLPPAAFPQKETFDIATFTPPKDWKKNSKPGLMMYTDIDSASGGFCMIAIYASTKSAGSARKDFAKEWKDLVAGPYKAEMNPKIEEQTTADGWKAITASAPIKLDSLDAYIIATVFSGFGKTTSVLVTLNHRDYLPLVDSFLDKISLNKTMKPPSAETNTSGGNTLLGTWSTSSSVIANYVTTSGAFVKSGDSHTMEEYEFKNNNTYVSKFFGSMNGQLYYTETAGSFTINGRNLTLRPARRRGGYSGNIHDEKNLLGKPETFDFYIGPNKWEAGPFLNLHKEGNYYAWSDYPYDYYKRVK